MFYVKVNKCKVKIYNLTNKQYEQLKNKIPNNIFYSITKNILDANYISLIIEQCEVTNILDSDMSIMKDNNVFNIFSIYRMENGINEFGIVSNISGIFSKYNISILYINTFCENLIFVNDYDYDKAIECLITLVDMKNIIF